MHTVVRTLDTQPPTVVAGPLAARLIGQTIQELDRLLAESATRPGKLQEPPSWFPLLDAVDALQRIRYTHGNLFRATFLGVKLCRTRLLEDPLDLYSYRELQRVRARLCAWHPTLEKVPSAKSDGLDRVESLSA